MAKLLCVFFFSLFVCLHLPFLLKPECLSMLVSVLQGLATLLSLASRSPNRFLDFLTSASKMTVPCLKVSEFISSIVKHSEMERKKKEGFQASFFALVFLESVAQLTSC